jgi:hypothetical protein
LSFDKLTGGKSGRKFDSNEPAVAKSPIPKAKQTIKRVFTLAGTTKSGYNFETLTRGQKVVLRLDPLGIKTNKHDDPTAVAVFDDEDNHIAYLARDQAKHVFKYLAEEILSAEANIFEIKGGYDDFHYGVDILVTFREV